MAKSNKATDKQLRVLNFVNDEKMKNGYAPTVREICEALNLKSTSTVHGYLARLEKKGLIQKNALKPRTIRVVNKMNLAEQKFYTSKEMVDVPIVGKVTAGTPILAVENVEDTFPLPIDFVGNSETFMLRVRGDSMIDAGILDGDLVLVRKQDDYLEYALISVIAQSGGYLLNFFYLKKYRKFGFSFL